ncbi:anti-sigma factor antagonist [Streptacidiphilus sp. MAP5-3]|jgi:hypothetical protein|uniref:anti-sigma factor antagonist n=1 Tax=unclassified Streptacidiphilus TaxID=2643834 RepID=UPI0035184F50
MTIQWHLSTGQHVDVLQISGFLGDDAVTRFNGAIGWALARGERTLLVDCTRLQGWSTEGAAAVSAAARSLDGERRALELVAPPVAVDDIPAYADLAAAFAHYQANLDGHLDGQGSGAWQSVHWDDGQAS